MEAIPSDRLVRLLSILEKNIRAAEKMSLIGDPVCITTIYVHILARYLSFGNY